MLLLGKCPHGIAAAAANQSLSVHKHCKCYQAQTKLVKNGCIYATIGANSLGVIRVWAGTKKLALVLFWLVHKRFERRNSTLKSTV
jgi:hypothetical protein